jgi:hypothetical protein
MKARGKREAKQSASPLVAIGEEIRPERPKYHRYYALSGLRGSLNL